jgi:Kae1-associated kinase Bud32
MQSKTIAQGAEAILTLEELEGRNVLVKDRVKKGYRLPVLDTKIRKLRTRCEGKLLDRARAAGIATPRVLRREESRLVMEYIDGERVKDVLNGKTEAGRKKIYELIGEATARMHAAGLVHGDLTTSNMILKDSRLYIIDFGLGKMSNKTEDQAVDLYLLYEALKSTHFKYLNESWQYVLKVYRHNYTSSAQVLKRLEKIEKRRRYKSGS